MHPKQLKIGVKFRDQALASQPLHARVHEIIGFNDNDTIDALHVQSGTVRKMPCSGDRLENYELVSTEVMALADLDALVGEEIVGMLVVGSRIRGIVTAVTYHTCSFGDGKLLRQVREIQLDRSLSTTYHLDDFTELKVVERKGRGR